MSASPAAADTCAGCGAELPRGARFCPDCGTPSDGGTTVQAELPPDETGPIPVSFTQVEPHWFGVTPPVFLLGIAGAVLLLSLVLFATGHWPYGLILLGLAALLFA